MWSSQGDAAPIAATAFGRRMGRRGMLRYALEVFGISEEDAEEILAMLNRDTR